MSTIPESVERALGWKTTGTVTVASGTMVKSFRNIGRAIDHAVKVSKAQYYLNRALEVCYIGPADALDSRGRGATVTRTVYVARGACVGFEKMP